MAEPSPRVQPEPDLETVVVGGGFSGLCTAIKLREAGIDDFLVLEKAGRIGGTWRDNTYPGAACDIPAVFYSFSFELKTDWTRKYPQQPEIFAYLEHCAQKYGLWPFIRLGTEVTGARWDEGSGRWLVSTADGATLRARNLVTGTGQLNRPAWPDIPGRDSFGGVSFHSARWEHDHDFTGKRIAVIGNGASAVQFIPELAGTAKHQYVFQRSANWITTRNDRPYTRFERWLFRHFPVILRLKRLSLWLQHEMRWPMFINPDGLLARFTQWGLLREMRKHVQDPELQRKLTPDYPAGCKRILITDDYYPTVARDDVDVIDERIERITPQGIVTRDGAEYPVDMIIYATGFQATDFLAPMRIVGRRGEELHDAWSGGAEAYLGVTLPGFPNFFMLYGPNTNLGHNSIIFMIEQQVRYIMRCITTRRERGLRLLELREDVMERWREECRASLDRTVWATHCNSWYKTADGRITNNWPYSTFTYWLRMRRASLADYHQEPEEGSGAMTGSAEAAAR